MTEAKNHTKPHEIKNQTKSHQIFYYDKRIDVGINYFTVTKDKTFLVWAHHTSSGSELYYTELINLRRGRDVLFARVDGSILGIAVDWFLHHVYVSVDVGQNVYTIQVFDIVTGAHVVILREETTSFYTHYPGENLDSLVVDPRYGVMFWPVSKYDRSSYTKIFEIHRASMSGKNRTVVRRNEVSFSKKTKKNSTQTPSPFEGLAIDYDDLRIYWHDYSLNIFSTDYEGEDFRQIFKAETILSMVNFKNARLSEIAIFGPDLYVSVVSELADTASILRLSKYNRTSASADQYKQEHERDVFRITVNIVHPSLQPLDSPFQSYLNFENFYNIASPSKVRF